jgi:hypothetical protein
MNVQEVETLGHRLHYVSAIARPNNQDNCNFHSNHLFANPWFFAEFTCFASYLNVKVHYLYNLKS